MESVFLPDYVDNRCHHNVLLYSFVWKQVKLLENHSDFLAVTVNVNLGISNVRSLKQDFAACGHFQKIQGTKEGGFSGTGRSDNGNNLALTDICGNSIQYLVCSKCFLQILYLDQNFALINAHWFSVSSPVYS